MSERVQSPRRFADVEVHQVFRRAAELQKRDPIRLEDLQALSLEELEQIAADAGIDVGQVHRAIAELDSRRAHEGSRLLGAPGQLHLERVLQGEVPTDDLPRLAEQIRQVLGDADQASIVGGTLTWAASATSSGPVDVMISRSSGRTVVALNARFGGLIGATYGGIGLGLGGGLGGPLATSIGMLSHSGGAAAGAAIVALSSAGLLARSIYSFIVRRRVRALSDLFARLCDQATLYAARSEKASP